jgi:hypothetical protein
MTSDCLPKRKLTSISPLGLANELKILCEDEPELPIVADKRLGRREASIVEVFGWKE